MAYIHTLLITITLVLAGHHSYSQDYSHFDCPFTVNNIVLKYPLTGGFHAPQFSQTDFNQDGIMDMFVFDRQGNVAMAFEYEGQGISEGYRFAPEYKPTFPDSLINWALMRDYNHDGLGDLFVSPTYGNASSFQLYEASLVDGQYKYTLRRMGKDENAAPYIYYMASTPPWINTYTPFTDVPEIIDVDNDGDLDLLAFDNSGGRVVYYQNQQVEQILPKDTMLFIKADDCFGRFKEAGTNAQVTLSPNFEDCAKNLNDDDDSAENKNGGVHAGSTTMAFDNNGDDAVELLLGDIGTSTLVYLENGGDNQNNVMIKVIDEYPDYDTPVNTDLFAASYNVDVDGDGLKDLVTSINWLGKSQNFNNVSYYKNTGDSLSRFEFKQNNFLSQETIDLGSYTAPVFLDENADGLMDILVGSGGYYNSSNDDISFIALYRNIGTKSAPAFELENEQYLIISSDGQTVRPAPAVGDMDGDGDMDMLVGFDSGQLHYYENTAGVNQPVRFKNPVANYMDLDIGDQSRPAIVDINNDGLNDIVIGEQRSNKYTLIPDTILLGSVSYFENIGTATEPAFSKIQNENPNVNTLGQMITYVSTNPGNETVSSAPCFIMNGDQLEVLIGSSSGDIKRYKVNRDNLVDRFEVVDSIVGGILEGRRTVLDAYDIDNDGYLEIVIGNARGGISMHNTDIMSEMTDTSEILDQSDILIFPNPAFEAITFKVEGEIDVEMATLYSISGQMLMRSIALDIPLNIKDLAVGIYLLHFETDKGTIVKKFSKM